MKAFRENIISYQDADQLSLILNQAYTSGEMIAPHWHNYYEVLYILDGEVREMIDGQERIISSEDIVIIAPGSVHTTYSITENCSIIVLLFFSSYLNSISPVATRYPGQGVQINGSIQLKSGYVESDNVNRQEFNRIFRRINEEYERKEKGHLYIIKGLMHEFLGLLYRSNAVIENVKTDHHHSKTMTETIEYIENNVDKQLLLKDVAASIGYTPEHFSRLFKEFTRQTFKQYVDTVKIAEAKRLLTFNDHRYTAANVADRLGFSNFSSFTRLFKRITGVSPSQFVGDIEKID